MIRLDHLTKSFRRTRVLDDLTLEIAGGDRVALIGSNGAGKTTLIRCILGQYGHEGRLSIDGKDPRKARGEVLGRIGFVPQLPPPLKMPVGELIRFAAHICKSPASRMEDIGIRLGLDFDEIRRRPFVKLSGGMKQKILISIAMGRDTGLLILDEPTANLDPAARQILFELLSERIDQSMIISSHRLEEVSGLVNRVIEMDRGKVVLDDHVEDAVNIAARQLCTVRIGRLEPAFAKAVEEWGFRSSAGGLEWSGEVAGPDRLQFLGMLSRYAGILSALDLREGPR